ncbi:MAG: radical SAM protein [Bacteroidales bacterium]|nr:radical SAM protein [Bacteroidales bacterium]
MNKKFYITTLGCKVNQYEGGQMIAEYKSLGYQQTKKMEEADICVINTCAVTQKAEKKSRNLVSRANKICVDVIVCGCTTDREYNKSVCGFNSVQSRRKAYIKVQDGCNNFCSYCIVPYIRGRSVSLPLANIVKEIKEIPQKEIVLVGIDLSDYNDFKNLCTEVNKTGKKFELSNVEVRIITDGLLRTLKTCENFIPYFGLPMQSGSDKVLKDMNRKYNSQQYLDAVNLIRTHFPNARVSADIIVGFPTETEEDYQDTVEMVKKIKFDDIHVFPYSNREGTVASRRFPKQLHNQTITDRVSNLINVQNHIKK